MVEEHANRVLELSLVFRSQISGIVDDIVASTSAKLLSGVSVVNGFVEQTPDNAKAILSVADTFGQVLESSDYYPTILAFVSLFVDQVDEFQTFFHEMPIAADSMPLNEDDREVLANQAAAAVGVLDGVSARTHLNLQQFLARSLGEAGIEELVKGVSDVVRKMSDVEQLAKDQLIIFFRSISSLVYRKVESGGTKYLYKYVGPTRGSTRGFCSDLAGGRSYSLEEIAALDNGQVPGVLSNGGGYGCDHFWIISGVLQ
jgi:hypothetical protein